MAHAKKSTVEGNDQNFEQLMEQSHRKVVLVDFWAPWCGPCRMMEPILEEVAATLSEQAIVAKFNTEDNPRVPAAIGIRAIPTLIVIVNGEIVDVFVGVKSARALVRAVKKYGQKVRGIDTRKAS